MFVRAENSSSQTITYSVHTNCVIGSPSLNGLHSNARYLRITAGTAGNIFLAGLKRHVIIFAGPNTAIMMVFSYMVKISEATPHLTESLYILAVLPVQLQYEIDRSLLFLFHNGIGTILFKSGASLR